MERLIRDRFRSVEHYVPIYKDLRANRKFWVSLLGLMVIGGCSDIHFASHDQEADKPAPFEESKKPLPGYPRGGDLLPVVIDGESSPFTYAIDSQSLATTEDGVVSYTVAIISGTGAKNVLREGIRCGAKEYKTYAYGTQESRFQETQDAVWQKISTKGPTRYRNELFTYYLCDANRFPLKPKQIVARLKHPNTIPSPLNPDQ